MPKPSQPYEEINDPTSSPLLVAEYQSLRTEIVKLIELQNQLLVLVILAFGTVVSVGIQTTSSSAILVFPFLSLIMCLNWLSHAHGIARCARYLRMLETKVGPEHLGWEHFVKANPWPYGWIGFWGVRTVFVATSLLAVLTALSISGSGDFDILLLSLSTAATIATLTVAYVWRAE